MMFYETNSAEETFEIARKFGENAKPGDVYTLDRDLGVGKTVFAKGFASGLVVRDVVSSPTFTIVNIYWHSIILMSTGSGTARRCLRSGLTTTYTGTGYLL